MPNITPRLGLKKPLPTEVADISVINENADILDGIVAKKSELTATNISIVDAKNHFQSTNVEGALDELFTGASNVKIEVADAITGMGVPASPTDTGAQLADKIRQLWFGRKCESGTTTARAVVNSWTYDVKVTGLRFQPTIVFLRTNTGDERFMKIYWSSPIFDLYTMRENREPELPSVASTEKRAWKILPDGFETKMSMTTGTEREIAWIAIQ